MGKKNELGMGSPLGYLGRWCGTGSMALDGEGGSAWQSIAGDGVLEAPQAMAYRF